MFSRSLIRIAALLVTASLLIASECSPTPERLCVPGETQDCGCGGGETGVQTCNSEGSGWGACLRCPGLTMPDAGPPPMCYPPGFPMITCNCSGFALIGNVIEYSGCCSHQALVTQCTGYCPSGIGYPWADVCL